MADPSEYDTSMPQVQQNVAAFERVLAVVRRAHTGDEVEEVRLALVTALAAEGLTVWNEVLDDAALQISAGEPG